MSLRPQSRRLLGSAGGEIGFFRRRPAVEKGPSAAERAVAVQALLDVRDAAIGSHGGSPVDPGDEDALRVLIYGAWLTQIRTQEVEHRPVQARRLDRKQLRQARRAEIDMLLKQTAKALGLPPRAIAGSYGLRGLHTRIALGVIRRRDVTELPPMDADDFLAQLRRMQWAFPMQENGRPAG